MKLILVMVFVTISAVSAAQNANCITSVSQAIEIAQSNSRQLFLKRQKVLENLRLQRMSFRDFLPQVSFSIAESDSITVHAPDSRTKNIQVFITQPVFNGGRTLLEYKLGRSSAEFEYKNYLVSEKEFMSAIGAAYYKAVLTKKNSEVKKTLIDAAEKQLYILQRETELGKSLETDYLEYQIAFASVTSDFRNALWEADQALRYLRVSMGFSPHAPIEVCDEGSVSVEVSKLKEKEAIFVSRAKMVSVSIQRMRSEQYYREKIRRYDERKNLPTITFQGSVSFSGKSWPLTEPVYSLRCTISFLNRYFPTSVSTGSGWKKGNLQSLSNSAETKILSSSTGRYERKIALLDTQSEQAEIEQALKDLELAICSAVYEHDCLVDGIELQKRAIQLMDSLLVIDSLRKKRGELKSIDYLQHLIDITAAKIALFEQEVQLQAVKKSLGILLNLPFEKL